MQKTLLSGVALVALTGFASAADMPLKAAPVPVYVSTWTGCYIGGHAGYGKETFHRPVHRDPAWNLRQLHGLQ